MMTRPPRPVSARILILADLMPREDGTFVLRPRVPERDLDTWISVKEACEQIGVSRRGTYLLCEAAEPYLVTRRPVPGLILVSLKSVRTFIAATADADFWDSPSRKNELLARNRARIAALSTDGN